MAARINRIVAIVGIAGVAFLSSAGRAGAQGGGPHGGMGGGGRMYNPATVETVHGEVVRVEEVPHQARGRSHGIHLILKTAAGEIPVHLGPAWYLDKQTVKLAPKDQIEVRGSRITFNGKPAIVAAQITKGGQVLQLRDDRGVPAWAGQGRRGP